ncbi:hypothetical protein, partial [Flavobacterium hiemivividum]|uniref:hypothetical protein n=1 Tax=Flavobacterium hiemivividum TaxID=2541734 RepID=UPI001A9D6AFE
MVEPAALGQPATVTVTLYVPAVARVTPEILGFCNPELKLFGPVQLYVAPETKGVVRFKVEPTHNGPLFDAVGVAGIGLTTTVVEPAALGQPATVTVTLYVPAVARVTPEILGFCNPELKLFGPVQLYVAPETKGVVRFKVEPTHSGPLFDAVGVAGIGLTTTVVEPSALGQPATVTITLYVPAVARVTPEILGFCNPEL